MYNLFTGINAIEFGRKFQQQDDCYQYLYSIKWKDGYRCKFCGCADDIQGKTRYHRRCKSCRYDESVTANTLFHGLRMPVLKAFHLLFRTVTKKMGMSSVELSTEVGVQQKTAWRFKLKVKNAMIQEKQKKVEGIVQVDETLIGGYSQGNIGRSLGEKSAVLFAVEDIGEGKTGNIRMETIEGFKADILNVAIDNIVEQGSKIKTDNHRSYNKLKKDGKDIETSNSDKGDLLPQLHKQIMCFKNWLRGTHLCCSEKYLQTYIDEYVFRFNRRNSRKGIFNSIIFKIMNATPKTYRHLITQCAQNT